MLYQETGTLEAEGVQHSSSITHLFSYYRTPVLGNPLISLIKLYATSLTMFNSRRVKAGSAGDFEFGRIEIMVHRLHSYTKSKKAETTS